MLNTALFCATCAIFMTRHSCIILHCPFFTPIYAGKGVNHSIKRIRYGLLACLQYLQPGWEEHLWKPFCWHAFWWKCLAHLDHFMTYFTVAVGEIKIIVIIFVGIKWWHHSDWSCFLHTPVYVKEGNYNIVHLISYCIKLEAARRIFSRHSSIHHLCRDCRQEADCSPGLYYSIFHYINYILGHTHPP